MDTQLDALPILPVLARGVSGCVNSANLDKSRQCTAHLFSLWIPSSARGIDGGPRRFTEVVLNEQALPVASMKSSRSPDATSATLAKTSLAAMASVDLSELRFSLLFSTARPSGTGESGSCASWFWQCDPSASPCSQVLHLLVSILGFRPR